MNNELEKAYPKEARIKEAKEISRNYGRLQEVGEIMAELYEKKFINIEMNHIDIKEIAMAIMELTFIIKDIEMNRIIAEKNIT